MVRTPFPTNFASPHVKFTGNFSSERSKYVTGGGSNNREVPPLIQKPTGPTAYNWQTFQSEAVESTSTSSFKMEQAPEVTDCIQAESIEVLEAFHTTLSFILFSERARSLQLLRNIFIRIPKENRRYVLTVKWATGTMSKDKFGPELSGHIAS